MSPVPPPNRVADNEIYELIEVLHEVEQRLEHLTAGEVDTVANRAGQTLLLRRSQEAVRDSHIARQAAILGALPANVALLDTQGSIVSVNDAWGRVADMNIVRGPDLGVGRNYLQICEEAQGEGSADAHLAAAGIRSVLFGAAPAFSMEYSCSTAAGQRCFMLTVTRLAEDLPKGAVVMHVDVTAQREAQERVRVSELRFRQMAENIREVFYLHSVDGSQMYYLSPAFEQIWGVSCASLYANPLAYVQYIHPEDLAETMRRVEAGRSAGYDFEHRIVRPDGEMRWIWTRSFAILDDNGKAFRIAGVAADITARKEAEQKVRRLNRVYAVLSGINSLIMRASDRDELFRESCRIAVDEGAFQMAWIGVIDPQTQRGKVVAWVGGEEAHVARVKLTALPDTPESDLPACRAARLGGPVICNDIANDPAVATFRDDLMKRGHKAAAWFPLKVAGRPAAVVALFSGERDVFDAEETRLLLELAGDISFALDHLAKSDQLHYVAYYDLLTGLANRRLFLERVTQYMHSAATGKHKLALCVMDLDRFKNINDTFGQPAADAFLKQVTHWMKEHLGDANLLARVGPDVFGAVMPKVVHDEDVARLLERTMEIFLNHPFVLNESTFRVAAKVGVALFPEDGETADLLFANAESALKKAKAGGDRYLFYAQKMTETVTGRLVMEYQLRHALENDEFVLHYQPKVSLATGRLTSCEALIRWNDPRKGLIPPGQFIPILEETGLIFEVGRWALHKAVADYLHWRAAGLPAVRIAVNVSPLQLCNRAFLADIRAAIGIDVHAREGLELELTESMIMKDIKHTIASLQEIRGMGVSVAIDDFGTGFSSLSYLAKLPVDTLKIDRSFIAEMTEGPEGLALVSMIITLAHSLKLKVVAEGVETDEQSRVLRLLNCDEMQGFLFSKPLPCALFETKFLGAGAARPG